MTNPAPLPRSQRMRHYEELYRHVIPGKSYTVIRVDGRAFHTYTRGMIRPFAPFLMTAMDGAAEALAAEVQGCQLAFTQSDEISVLVTDFGSMQEPWFGGNVQKMVSVAASVATSAFNGRIVGSPSNAQFDARVFTLPSRDEVVSYFMWRQADCYRNAVSMIAETRFSHRQLLGLNTQGRIDVLAEAGVDVAGFPQGCLLGRVTTRETFQEEVSYVDKRSGEVMTVDAIRSRWVTAAAPDFGWEPDGFLQTRIPDKAEEGVDVEAA